MSIWFEEGNEFGDGYLLKLKVSKVIYKSQSQFQSIEIFENPLFGKVLLLDDIIQVTEKDEKNYHEMFSHVPLFSHPSPKNVIVIGGGDGGNIREIVKHSSIEKIVLCELDSEVVSTCRKYLPELTAGLDDPRVIIEYKDGCKYVQDHKSTFDIILVDSTDPIGPSEVLFKEPFFKDMKSALRPGGIIVTQAENFHHPEQKKVILDLFKFVPNLFKYAKYYFTLVPTYATGTMGFTFLSDEPYFQKQPRPCTIDNLEYYNTEIHKAAFCLPTGFAKVLYGEK